MASKFKIKTIEDRINQMKTDNPRHNVDLISTSAWSLRIDALNKVNQMIPARFKDAEITDAGILSNDIQSAVIDMFLPYPKGNAGIIFTGPAGCGKTHTAIATMKWIAEKDPECVAYFGLYPKIVQELRTEFSDGSYNESGSTWDKITNDSGLFGGLVVIDDIASAKPTEFELEKLFMMIDRRTNEFFPTIITTNIPFDKFEEVFGQRISSRLLGYFTIINFPDHDYRDK